MALYVLAGVMIFVPDKMCKSKKMSVVRSLVAALAGVMVFAPSQVYKSEKMRIARSLVTALAGVTAIVVFLFEPTSIWKWGIICCAGVLVAVSCREVYRILKK